MVEIDLVLQERKGAVAIVTLNRPQRHNSLVPALQIANEIAHKIPGSIHRTRRLLFWDRDELAARLAAEQEQFVLQMVTGEGLSGFVEFLEELGSGRARA